MKKFILILLIILSPITSISVGALDNTKVESISENSEDINVDKLKIQISDDLILETGFGNNSGTGAGWVKVVQQLLQYLTLVIGIVFIIAALFISTSMIFNSANPDKIKEYKQILFKIVIGFLFYTFAAGGTYVWLIKDVEKYSNGYLNETIEKELQDNKPLKPTLLK